MPDWVLGGFAAEASLTIDVNIEFKSDAVIKASKNYAVRYCRVPISVHSIISSRLKTSSNTFTRAPSWGDDEVRWGFECFNATLIDGGVQDGNVRSCCQFISRRQIKGLQKTTGPFLSKEIRANY